MEYNSCKHSTSKQRHAQKLHTHTHMFQLKYFNIQVELGFSNFEMLLVSLELML